MRDHDLELIAALVEGRLDDESEARALIDSSPELREEYEAQKTVFEALSSLAPVSMTETERAVLRRDVWTELRHQPSQARRSGSWYYRWVGVAGGALVMVGLVAVLGQGMGGNDAGGETFAEIAADLDSGGGAATTVATEDAAGDEIDPPQTLSGAGDDSAEEDGAESDGAEPGGSESSFYSGEADKVRTAQFSAPLERYEQTGAESEITSCLETAGLDEHRVVATLTPPPELAEQGQMVVVMPEGADPETASVTFVSLEACQVVHVDE